MKRTTFAKLALPLLAATALVGAQETPSPVTGPFGLTRLATTDGSPANLHDFAANEECALCHRRQLEELNGSMHSVTHTDPFYRAFAELARAEAGEEVYTYCAGCHSPGGVVTGMIPGVPEDKLPRVAKDGVTCEVCHKVSALNGTDGPWGEPGNASLTLETGTERKFGPAHIDRTLGHGAAGRDFYRRSEYCGSCHTVIHPTNGMRLEHTYDEWKKSVYAANDIHCQDCHLRSVEDAIEAARTLRPVPRPRMAWGMNGMPRPTSFHYFVGGNADAVALGGDRVHAKMAVARLQSAATIAIEASTTADDTLAFDVVVTNVGAGHGIPTSLTELREVWIHIRVTDSAGNALYESGVLDDHGEVLPGALRFGSHTVDAKGEVTHKPWEAVGFGWQRLIPPKESVRDAVQAPLPAGTTGPVTIETRLLYRTAPPHVIEMVMGEEAYEPKVVEMCTARVEVVID